MGFSSIDEQLSLDKWLIHAEIKDEKLGFKPNPQYPEHDFNGFRNKNVPDRADIICLGDSQTYGVGVTAGKSWPSQLESKTNEKVYNMAFSGWGPIQSLILLEDAMDFRPKVIIYAFYLGNDLYDAYHSIYSRNLFNEFKTQDESLSAIFEELDSLESFHQLILRVKGKVEVQSKEKPWPLRDYFAKYSKLWGLLRASRQTFREMFVSPENKSVSWESAKSFAVDNKQWCEVFEKGTLRTIFTSTYRKIGFNLYDPRIREGFRISMDAIQKMNKLAVSKSIKFIVLLIPTKEYVFRDFVLQEMSSMSENYKELVENEERLWKDSKTFFQEKNINYIDSLQTLRKVLIKGEQPYFITANSHPNEIGHERIAFLVQSKLKSWGAKNITK